MKRTLFLIFVILFSFTNISTATIATVSFNSATPSPPSACNDTWSENSIPLQVVPIPPSSTCYFDYDGMGGLWLFPARLTADLSGLGTINSIEIDITDFCGVGCTSGEVTNGGASVATFSNSVVGSLETIVFTNTGNAAIDGVFMQSFEGLIHEIRIDYTSGGGGTPPSNDCFVVVPFNDASPNVPSSCNDSWSESYVPQQVVPIPPSTTCSFDFSNGVFSLFPARLVMDLSGFSDIEKIEIDLTDACGVGCSTAEIFANGISVSSFSNSATGAQTFIFNNTNQEEVDELYIQSFEGFVSEVRLYMDMTACAGVLTLNGGNINPGTYSGCEKVFSSTEVMGVVDFVSETDICLTTGFLASVGSDFTAYLDPAYCTPPVFNFEPPVLNLTTEKNPDFFQVVKNSSSDNLQIILELEKTSRVQMTVHNLNGQLFETIVNDNIMESGHYQIQHHIGNLPAGIYFVTVWKNSQPTTRKISVMN